MSRCNDGTEAMTRRRTTQSLPLMQAIRPAMYVPGGWFDPFEPGFACFVVTNYPELCARPRDQSAYRFIAAHHALGQMYEGHCVCISCHTNEVDLRDANAGFVIATLSDDDYDFHALTGCGICTWCCSSQPDLEDRLSKGFHVMLEQKFASFKAMIRH